MFIQYSNEKNLIELIYQSSEGGRQSSFSKGAFYGAQGNTNGLVSSPEYEDPSESVLILQGNYWMNEKWKFTYGLKRSKWSGQAQQCDFGPVSTVQSECFWDQPGFNYSDDLNAVYDAVVYDVLLGAADVGIPLTDDGRAFLLPRNVAAFGDGLGIPADEVRLYVALRESAAQRLFAHVPWLRSQLTAAVEAYAAGIHVDRDRIEEAARGIDPSNPEAMQEVLASGVFVPEETPEQLAALARLEEGHRVIPERPLMASRKAPPAPAPTLVGAPAPRARAASYKWALSSTHGLVPCSPRSPPLPRR